MISFAGYTFDDHKAAFLCRHVWGGSPVLLFVHDHDGETQFMCGEEGHTDDDFIVIGLSHLLEHMRSIPDVPITDMGFFGRTE